MELKHIHPQSSTSKSAGFNRTFMELKHQQLTTTALDITGFNRTFMELKHNFPKFGVMTEEVLIGPSWN